MTVSKLRAGFLAFYVLCTGAQAFGSDTRLHCEGFHALDAVVQSETSLSAVTLADSAVTHQACGGKKIAHLNTQKAFGSPVDQDNDGVVPSGQVVVFYLDETDWGYGLVLPSGFDKKTKFSASLADWEPADNDGVTYHDLQCTITQGNE
jgi:hypothetical protein